MNVAVGRPEQENKITRHRKQMIHEGRFAAEIDLKIEEDGSPWGPTVEKKDVLKTACVPLYRGDISAAAKEANVFELLPLAGE